MAANAPPWWAYRWLLLTVIAWAVLLVTAGTWWWLDNGSAGNQTRDLGPAVVEQDYPTQVSEQSEEGLAWNVSR